MFSWPTRLLVAQKSIVKVLNKTVTKRTKSVFLLSSSSSSYRRDISNQSWSFYTEQCMNSSFYGIHCSWSWVDGIKHFVRLWICEEEKMIGAAYVSPSTFCFFPHCPALVLLLWTCFGSDDESGKFPPVKVLLMLTHYRKCCIWALFWGKYSIWFHLMLYYHFSKPTGCSSTLLCHVQQWFHDVSVYQSVSQ